MFIRNSLPAVRTHSIHPFTLSCLLFHSLGGAEIETRRRSPGKTEVHSNKPPCVRNGIALRKYSAHMARLALTLRKKGLSWRNELNSVCACGPAMQQMPNGRCPFTVVGVEIPHLLEARTGSSGSYYYQLLLPALHSKVIIGNLRVF